MLDLDKIVQSSSSDNSFEDNDSEEYSGSYNTH